MTPQTAVTPQKDQTISLKFYILGRITRNIALVLRIRVLFFRFQNSSETFKSYTYNEFLFGDGILFVTNNFRQNLYHAQFPKF